MKNLFLYDFYLFENEKFKKKNIENVNKIFTLLLIVKMRNKKKFKSVNSICYNHSICIYVSLLKKIVNFTKKNCQNVKFYEGFFLKKYFKFSKNI
jgi:hypothetical protein